MWPRTYIRIVLHVRSHGPTPIYVSAYANVRINSAHNILGFLTANLSDTQHNQPRYSECYHRSGKVAVCLGFQDFSQLVRDYGDKEAKVVMNTVGNIFSGQVVGETAKTLSERFGKVLQKRQSISINRQDVSTSINTQMDALIPPSKISGLTQGMFVGSVSDNFNERIEQKIFHCEIVVDAEKVKREESAYKKIPVITNFTDEDGNDRMKETVQANYRRIKEEVKQIVQEELERIKNDPVLCKLLPDNETV